MSDRTDSIVAALVERFGDEAERVAQKQTQHAEDALMTLRWAEVWQRVAALTHQNRQRG